VAVVVALVAAAWLDAVVPDLVRWVRSA
jgi:hypothetical protein